VRRKKRKRAFVKEEGPVNGCKILRKKGGGETSAETWREIPSEKKKKEDRGTGWTAVKGKEGPMNPRGPSSRGFPIGLGGKKKKEKTPRRGTALQKKKNGTTCDWMGTLEEQNGKTKKQSGHQRGGVVDRKKKNNGRQKKKGGLIKF